MSKKFLDESAIIVVLSKRTVIVNLGDRYGLDGQDWWGEGKGLMMHISTSHSAIAIGRDEDKAECQDIFAVSLPQHGRVHHTTKCHMRSCFVDMRSA